MYEIEDDNMSITRSISVAHTDYRVLKARLCRLGPRYLSVHTKRPRYTKDTFAAR